MPEEYEQDSDHEAKDDEAADEPYDTNNSSESDEDEGGRMEDELRGPAKDVHGSEDEDESAEDPGDTRDDQKSDNDEAEPTEEPGEAKKDRHEADDEPSAESSRKPRRRSALRPSRFNSSSIKAAGRRKQASDPAVSAARFHLCTAVAREPFEATADLRNIRDFNREHCGSGSGPSRGDCRC